MCSDIDASASPTCSIAFEFIDVLGGKQVGFSYHGRDQALLDQAIAKFDERISQVTDHGDAIRLLGEPYMKARHKWYYRLPERPDDVLFTLEFYPMGRLKSAWLYERANYLTGLVDPRTC